MGSLRLTYSNYIAHVNRSLSSPFSSSTLTGRHRSPRHRFLVKACSSSTSSGADLAATNTRRQIITHTAAIVSLFVAPIPGVQPSARSEEPALSEWERVYLPIDPGVVLLDISFVPDDPNHGICPRSAYCSARSTGAAINCSARPTEAAIPVNRDRVALRSTGVLNTLRLARTEGDIG